MSPRKPPKPRSADSPLAAIEVRVIPRAGRSGLAGMRDGAVLVRLAAAPVDGAANDELIAVLAAALGVSRRAIVIESGARSRAKRVRVAGMDRARALAILCGGAG
jgi:uncharacterized protein (TIGR00251 family)